MSSGIGEIYDDHRDYVRLCKQLGEAPRGGLPLASFAEWNAHWEELKTRDHKEGSEQ